MVSPKATSFFERHLASNAGNGPCAAIPDDVRFEDAEMGGHPGRWCVPAAAAEIVVSVDAPWPAAVLFLPGVDGPLGSEPLAWAAQLASRSGVQVLLPTSTAPATDATALDEVYRRLIGEGGFWSAHLALVAEGAAAAAPTLLDDLARGGRIPDGPGLVFLISPWVDPHVGRSARSRPRRAPTAARRGGPETGRRPRAFRRRPPPGRARSPPPTQRPDRTHHRRERRHGACRRRRGPDRRCARRHPGLRGRTTSR